MCEVIKCFKCNQEGSRRDLKRIKKQWICRNCESTMRKEHREFLKRKVLGIRTRKQQVAEWKEKRENKLLLPKIKSIKPKKKTSALGLYITRDEKDVIYKTLIKNGLDSKTAKKRIKNLCNKMKELKEQIGIKIKDETELNKEFKRQFEELVKCQQ